MELIQGIYTDGSGTHTLVPVAVDAAGQLLGGGGGGGGAATSTDANMTAIGDVAHEDALDILAAIVEPSLRAVINGEIVTASQSQDVLAADATRKYIEFFPASADYWVNFGADAGLNVGIPIYSSGGGWYSPANIAVRSKITIWCATAGTKFVVLQG